MHYYGIYICAPDLTPVSRQELELKTPWLKFYLLFEGPSFVFLLDDAHAAMEFGGAPVNVVVAMSEDLGTDTLVEIVRYTFADSFVFALPYVSEPTQLLDDNQVIGRLACGWMSYATEADCFEWTTPVPPRLQDVEHPLTHSGSIEGGTK